jgi:hypothetical protein
MQFLSSNNGRFSEKFNALKLIQISSSLLSETIDDQPGILSFNTANKTNVFRDC